MVELSAKQVTHVRRVYTLIDMLAGIGGLFNTLYLVCLIIITIFHFYGSYHFLSQDLFTDNKRRVKTSRKAIEIFRPGRSWFMTVRPQLPVLERSVQWDAWRTLKINCMTFVWPYCKRLCKCKKLNRYRLRQVKSLKHVTAEVSISSIIK